MVLGSKRFPDYTKNLRGSKEKNTGERDVQRTFAGNNAFVTLTQMISGVGYRVIRDSCDVGFKNKPDDQAYRFC